MAKSREKSHIEIQQDKIETAKKEQRLKKLHFTKEQRKKMEAKELEETKERVWGKDERDDEIKEESEKLREEESEEKEEEESKEKSEKEQINELQEFTQKVAESARAEGVPVSDDCRIDMNAFEGLECDMRGIYSRERIEKDEKLANRSLDRGGRQKPEEKLKAKGEQLEMLKTCIFHKFLKDDFIVVRSSSYDDVRNGVDNIVLEKKTGKILCAIDEVADNSGKRFQQKQEKIAEENLRNGGTFVKYGIDIKDEKVVLAPRMNVPVFYLALSKNQVEKGVKDFKVSGEKSDTEEAYYKEFISSMLEQTSLMSSEYENSNINKNLKENINYFYNILEKIQNQK